MSEKSKEVDHCGNCTLKGDLKKCLEAPCQIHDSWAFREMLQKTQQLEKELAELKETLKVSEANMINQKYWNRLESTAVQPHPLKKLAESQKLPDFETSKILNDNFHDLVGEEPTAEAGE